MALSVPVLASNLVEPILGVLGNTRSRQRIILVGGLLYAAALAVAALAASFTLFLIAMTALYPASGAFVGLSQANLMDSRAEGRDESMAWWNLSGSVGVLAGSLVLAAFALVHSGWRPLFVCLAALTILCLFLMTASQPGRPAVPAEGIPVRQAICDFLPVLRRLEVVRWLLLLEASDLLLDVLLSYLALYLVLTGASPTQAALGVTLWSVAWLIGGGGVIHLFARVSGLKYVRVTAVLELALFPALLLAPGFMSKLVLMFLVALVNAGWYPALKAQLYDAVPEQSGSVMALSSLAGSCMGFVVLALGLIAQHAGLGTALWLLLLGPVALVLGVPRYGPKAKCQT